MAPLADLVVRFQGGNNAGHTLVVEGEQTVLHVVPSGVLHGDTVNLIGPGVVVAEGAEVRDSIIMNDTQVGPGAAVDRAVVDKEVLIGEGANVGFGDDNTPNAALPEVLNTGVSLVGKRAHVPANAVLGRNVVISPGVTAEGYPASDIHSGASV